MERVGPVEVKSRERVIGWTEWWEDGWTGRQIHGLEADSDWGVDGIGETGEGPRGGGGGLVGESLEADRCGYGCSWLAKGPQGGLGPKAPQPCWFSGTPVSVC